MNSLKEAQTIPLHLPTTPPKFLKKTSKATIPVTVANFLKKKIISVNIKLTSTAVKAFTSFSILMTDVLTPKK